MEDVPVNPVNQVSGSRETRCKTFMKQMAGDVFGEAFLDLYWPVNLLHCAIYICFGVSLSYSFLWFSRFAQAQCGKYRIFGGSTANCTFEVVGFLVYVWMTCLSVKLIWYYDDVNGQRYRQLKASFSKSVVGLLDTLKSAKNSIDLLQDTMQLVQNNAKPAQVQLAVNMLRQCMKRNIELPKEAIVQYLSSFYPVLPAASEDVKEWLRNMLEKLNDENVAKPISENIIESWKNYHKSKSDSFNDCQRGSWLWIEIASSLEGAKTLGNTQEMKSMRLYVQKANAPLDEIVLDAEYYRDHLPELQEFLASKWAEHSKDLGPADHGRDMPALSFYALLSNRASVDVNFSPLPQCTFEFPRCCCPSICYCFLRCWESLRCAYHRNDQLPLLDISPDYENRRCSLVCCSIDLVSQLQEQLLTTLGFASIFCLFNLGNVVVGVLDGCEAGSPLPCGLMLIQRTVGVLYTCIFIASTIFCLQTDNFKRLEPLVTMFEMTAGLEKLARQAQGFKDGLGSMDELCRKVRTSEETKKLTSEFITSFSDSESRGSIEEMEKDVQGFLKAMRPVGVVQ